MTRPSFIIGLVLVTSLGVVPSAVAQDRVDDPAAFMRYFTAPGPALEGLVDPISWPKANAFSPAVATLGARLFADPSLSADGEISCATCHAPEHAFSSPTPRPAGVYGRRGERHPPTLVNRGYGKVQFWDGRVATLEEQVIMPLTDEKEMGMTMDGIIEKLGRHREYPALFGEAFGRAPQPNDLAKALATYVRGLTSGNSAVDRFRAGDGTTLDVLAKTGLWIFESKGNCWRCHGGPNFTDEDFHNTGIGVKDGKPRPGRFVVTKKESDHGRFKTPTLRDVGRRGPFMHDGSLATLEDVVEFYRRGGNANSHLDAVMKPIALSDREAAGLVAFLKALSSPVPAPLESKTDGKDDVKPTDDSEPTKRK